MYGSEWTGDYDFDYSFAPGVKTQASGSAGLGVLRAASYSIATSDPKNYFCTASSGESVEITVHAGTQYGPVVLKFNLTLSGTESVTPGNAGLAG